MYRRRYYKESIGWITSNEWYEPFNIAIPLQPKISRDELINWINSLSITTGSKKKVDTDRSGV